MILADARRQIRGRDSDGWLGPTRLSHSIRHPPVFSYATTPLIASTTNISFGHFDDWREPRELKIHIAGCRQGQIRIGPAIRAQMRRARRHPQWTLSCHLLFQSHRQKGPHHEAACHQIKCGATRRHRHQDVGGICGIDTRDTPSSSPLIPTMTGSAYTIPGPMDR